MSSNPALPVRLVWPPPSSAIEWTSELPSRSELNAIADVPATDEVVNVRSVWQFTRLGVSSSSETHSWEW